MSLPVSVGFLSRNNHKYLRYISEDKQNQLHGFLQFSGDELVTPYSKFNVEVAKTGEGSFVHIRSTYNNKYLVLSSTNHGWIHAGADESNEDQSSSSCTMLVHYVQLGNYLSLEIGSEPFTSCLFAGSTNNNHDNFDVFVITNLETLFVLPKHITFKGDNGSYLSGRLTFNLPYLQFISDNNKDATVWYENFMNNDGSVCVKSDYFDNNYTTTVPANTKVTVTVMATKASFDIPFKYTQKDTLFNMKEIIYNFDDGLFTGSNLFDFKYDVKQEPIAK